MQPAVPAICSCWPWPPQSLFGLVCVEGKVILLSNRQGCFLPGSCTLTGWWCRLGWRCSDMCTGWRVWDWSSNHVGILCWLWAQLWSVCQKAQNPAAGGSWDAEVWMPLNQRAPVDSTKSKAVVFEKDRSMDFVCKQSLGHTEFSILIKQNKKKRRKENRDH